MVKLSPESLFVGQTVYFVDEVDSTNDYLKQLANTKKLTEGTVVFTNYQSNGRGQKQNVWTSKLGDNALFSVLLYPNHIQANQLAMLNFAISLGVRAAIQQYIPQKKVEVKWPNDIYVEDKKIAGILIENKLAKNIESVIGIGINVNQEVWTNLKGVTSLRLLGTQVDPQMVIQKCLEFVEKYYLLSKQSNGAKQIHDLYVTQLYKLNEEVIMDGQNFIVKSVTASGKLQIERSGISMEIGLNERKIVWN